MKRNRVTKPEARGRLWWLSFCDPKRPEGKQFLGVSIVPVSADGHVGDACQAAWAAGCNPGGEVMGLALPVGPSLFRATDLCRLLTADEARKLAARTERLLRKSKHAGV